MVEDPRPLFPVIVYSRFPGGQDHQHAAGHIRRQPAQQDNIRSMSRSPPVRELHLGFTISDVLPDGFTYASTSAVNLSGGATRPTTETRQPGPPIPPGAFSTFQAGGGCDHIYCEHCLDGAGRNLSKPGNSNLSWIRPVKKPAEQPPRNMILRTRVKISRCSSPIICLT